MHTRNELPSILRDSIERFSFAFLVRNAKMFIIIDVSSPQVLGHFRLEFLAPAGAY